MALRSRHVAAATLGIIALISTACGTYPDFWDDLSSEQRQVELDKMLEAIYGDFDEDVGILRQCPHTGDELLFFGPEPEVRAVVEAVGDGYGTPQVEAVLEGQADVASRVTWADADADQLPELIADVETAIALLSQPGGATVPSAGAQLPVTFELNYLLFPAMGRTFYPGSFPRWVDSETSSAAVDRLDVPVHVIDTGYPAGFDDRLGVTHLFAPSGAAGLEVDSLARTGSAADSPHYWRGHGAFIDATIAQGETDRPILHWRINAPREDDLAWTTADLLSTSYRARVFHNGSLPGEPMITNLSLGMHDCSLDELTPPTAVRMAVDLLVGSCLAPPLLATAACADGSGPGLVVAAAGNSGDARLSWPAGLGLAERYANHERVVAVGATQSWSTNTWPEVVVEGCYVHPFPIDAAEYTYPDNTTGDLNIQASRITDDQRIEWCGTSFASAAVTARLALAMRDDPDLLSRLANPQDAAAVVEEYGPGA